MKVTVGLMSSALSSCHLSTGTTSVVCSIFAEQKNEADPRISTECSGSSPTNIQLCVGSMAESLFLTRSRSTQIRISLHVVREGPDVFSCCMNSFSICSILSGLRVSDTMCSATLYVGNRGERISEQGGPDLFPVHMVHMLYGGKIAQVQFEGEMDLVHVSNVVSRLVSACNREGELIKEKIEEAVRNGAV